jgi:hypothetical protein
VRRGVAGGLERRAVEEARVQRGRSRADGGRWRRTGIISISIVVAVRLHEAAQARDPPAGQRHVRDGRRRVRRAAAAPASAAAESGGGQLCWHARLGRVDVRPPAQTPPLARAKG